MKRKYLMLGWMALLVSCQTLEFPEPQVSNPVFYIKGDINGTSWQLNAGDEHYFLDTEWIRDSSQVPVFVSTLRPDSCNGLCANSFQMQLRYLTPSGAGDVDIDALLNADQSRRFLDNDVVDSVEFQFKSLAQCMELPVRSNWKIGDRKFSTSEVTVILPEAEQQVDYMIMDSSGTLAVQIVQPIDQVSIAAVEPSQSVKVNFTQDGRAVIIELSDTRDFGVTWSPVTSDGKRLIIREPIATRLSADIVWRDGSKGKVVIKLPEDNKLPASVCQAGFHYRAIQKISRPNPLQLNTVDLNYMDDRGKLYSTRFARQVNASFKVIDHEPYKANDSGLPTQKVYFLLNCTMADQAKTEKLVLENIEGVFAFAYPN